MPKVGKKSFSYSKQGKMDAAEYAMKMGMPMKMGAPAKMAKAMSKKGKKK